MQISIFLKYIESERFNIYFNSHLKLFSPLLPGKATLKNIQVHTLFEFLIN